MADIDGKLGVLAVMTCTDNKMLKATRTLLPPAQKSIRIFEPTLDRNFRDDWIGVSEVIPIKRNDEYLRIISSSSIEESILGYLLFQVETVLLIVNFFKS